MHRADARSDANATVALTLSRQELERLLQVLQSSRRLAEFGLGGLGPGDVPAIEGLVSAARSARRRRAGRLREALHGLRQPTLRPPIGRASAARERLIT